MHHLEGNIITLLRSACRCPLTREGIQRGSTKVTCKDTMAGTFQMELMLDGGYEYKESIICGMKKKIATENTPNICKYNSLSSWCARGLRVYRGIVLVKHVWIKDVRILGYSD